MHRARNKSWVWKRSAAVMLLAGLAFVFSWSGVKVSDYCASVTPLSSVNGVDIRLPPSVQFTENPSVNSLKLYLAESPVGTGLMTLGFISAVLAIVIVFQPPPKKRWQPSDPTPQLSRR